MRSSLRRPLCDALEFEEVSPDPGELLEPAREKVYSIEERAAKRRRIESIASQYLLQRRCPLIRTAQLRGPFGPANWQNPWAEPQSSPNSGLVEGTRAGAKSRRKQNQKQKEKSQDPFIKSQAQVTYGCDTQVEHGNAPTGSSRDNSHLCGTSGGCQAPETSHTFITRDFPQEEEIVGLAEGINKYTPGAASENTSFWLKRRKSGPASDDWGPRSSLSPSPQPTKANGSLIEHSLASHNQPPQVRRSPLADGEASMASCQLTSNAIPSMAISTQNMQGLIQHCIDKRKRLSNSGNTSPARAQNQLELLVRVGTAPGKPGFERPQADASKSQEALSLTVQQESRANSHGKLYTEDLGKSNVSAEPTRKSVTGANKSDNIPPKNADTIQESATPSSKTLDQGSQGAAALIEQGLRSAKELSLSALKQSQCTSPRVGLCKEDIQRSAHRCAAPPRSSPRRAGTSKKSHGPPQITKNLLGQEVCQSNDEEVSTKNGHTCKRRTKPRPVTFDSSPIKGRRPKHHAGEVEAIVSSKKTPDTGNTSLERRRAPRPDVYTVPDNDQVLDAPRDSKLSRYSDYSTQAAMAQAQLEFQEGSVPTYIGRSPGFGGDGEGEYLQEEGKGEMSPSVTSFYAFNAGLNQEPERDLPMSTQELFNAASPFSFSTVKKRGALPRRSNLRFTIHSTDEGEGRIGPRGDKKSPTSSGDRVPLKERNLHHSLRSVLNVSEKGSQESWEASPNMMSSGREGNVELPQLNFQGSMEGDFNFTDGILQNFEGVM